MGSTQDQITPLALSTEPLGVTTWEHLPLLALAGNRNQRPWKSFYPEPFFLPLVGSRTQLPRTSGVWIRLPHPPLGAGGGR